MQPGKPLRVVHVASGDLWAGAESQLLQLMRAQATRRDVQVSAALLNEGALAERLRESGIDVTVFREGESNVVKLLWRLTRFFVRTKPDVVHTHRVKENFIGAIASKFAGAVCVRTVHGRQEHRARGVLARRAWVNQLDWLMGRFLQHKVVGVSQELTRELARAFGEARAIYIANGIDADAVRVRAVSPRPIGTGKINIGVVGRLNPVKRVDVYLRVCAELERRRPAQFRFWVIGDGPLRKSLESLSDELGIRDSCEFVGFRSEPLELMAQLKALIITSDHEGLPMVALESLALGVPIVSHAVGGLAEIIESEKHGQLVPSQDVRLFADAIEFATSSSEDSGQSRLPARYGIQETASRYIELYAALTAKRP